MVSEQHTVNPQSSGGPGTITVNPILIFSPDADIARSLTLLLGETYTVEAETNLARLEEDINKLHPPLLLVDLYSLPPDIMRTVEILKRRTEKNPVIMFHVFRNSRPEIEQAIRGVSDLILYKPINAELVTELVSVLMAIHHNGAPAKEHGS